MGQGTRRRTPGPGLPAVGIRSAERGCGLPRLLYVPAPPHRRWPFDGQPDGSSFSPVRRDVPARPRTLRRLPEIGSRLCEIGKGRKRSRVLDSLSEGSPPADSTLWPGARGLFCRTFPNLAGSDSSDHAEVERGLHTRLVLYAFTDPFPGRHAGHRDDRIPQPFLWKFRGAAGHSIRQQDPAIQSDLRTPHGADVSSCSSSRRRHVREPRFTSQAGARQGDAARSCLRE